MTANNFAEPNNADELPDELVDVLIAYDEQGGPHSAMGDCNVQLPGALQDRLETAVHGLDLLHQVWPKEEPLIDQPEVKELGDFRIIREIGRGGMGIVYEAQQLSLSRRVALKVLPFAAVLDQHQLARFKNEAQAAASLTREGIVPVYGVGCDRGVHYYAMQLIEGRTLAEMIAELKGDRSTDLMIDDRDQKAGGRTETKAMAAESTWKSLGEPQRYRAAAELAAQAAESLEHAHSLGVVHRDIKPSNLIVDTGGRVWITDFGLARVEANPELTASGDLLGTLKYMAPEQAQGKPAAVDHRADVYGLGATLYELLTLRSVFRGDDRQAMLRQIANDDPTPLRELQPAVPRDLETIVLKALAKDAADRYATAAEMAADLRRFLADRPIVARPVTWLERLARVARRRPRAFGVAIGLLALLAVGLGLGMALVAREQAKTSAALARAEDNFQLAMTAVDRLTPSEASSSSVDKELALLRDAAELYHRLQEGNDDPKLVRQESEVLHRRAVFQRERGAYEEAVTAIRGAIRARQALTETDSPVVQDIRALSLDYNELGNIFWVWRKDAESESAYRQGLRVLKPRLDADPRAEEDAATQARLLVGVARNQWRTGKLAQAEWGFREAVTIEENLPAVKAGEAGALGDYAGTLSDFSMVLRDQNNRAAAITLLERAVDMQRQSLEAAPDNIQQRTFLANHLWQLAETQLKEGRYEQCMETAQQLVEVEPRRLRSYLEAAEFIFAATSELRIKGELDEAIAAAIDELEEVARGYLAEALLAPIADPEFAYFHVELLTHDPAAPYFDPASAIQMGERVVRRVPTRARFWTILALAHFRAGNWQQAEEALQRAAEVSPDDSQFNQLLLGALLHWERGEKAAARAAYDQACQDATQRLNGEHAEQALWAEAVERFGENSQGASGGD